MVSLATYNEAENLRDLVAEIRQAAPHATVLIIDDNSPDGTGAIAEEIKAAVPGGVDVIHRSGKLGLGTAILAAMKYAIDERYDYFLNMDADGSHPPRFIPAILDGMKDRDVMIGSRYVPGGGVEGEFNLKRKLMSTGINVYARMFLGLKTKDNSGSFRCYRVSKLAEMDLDRVIVARLLVHGRNPLLVPPGRLHLRRDAHPVREPPRRHLEDQQDGGRQGLADHRPVGRVPPLRRGEDGEALAVIFVGSALADHPVHGPQERTLRGIDPQPQPHRQAVP